MEPFKRSYLTMVLLSLLEEGEMYGYQLRKTIRERTKGRFAPWEGTLYPILHELEEMGVVESEWRSSSEGPERRYFRLTTPKGKKLLDRERENFGILADIVLATGKQRG